MNSDENLIILSRLDNIEYNGDTYQLNTSLGGNGGSSFKYTNKLNTDDHIFVKFLISPRSELELYKFKMEPAKGSGENDNLSSPLLY